MKSLFTAGFIAFSLVLTPLTASAASSAPTPPERFLVQSTKAFWRTAFGARNVFDTGFTANLTPFQVQFARIAGLKLVPVKTFDILAQTTPTPAASATPKAAPSVPVPWGVRTIIGSTTVGQGGANITVAVLDTGVDRNHPDLHDRITGCADFTDPVHNLIDDQCDDANGHGTHVAGIIAADGGAKGTGLYGVAPEANLFAYRVCTDDGSCRSDDIAVAIRAAVDNGANIIVLGFGGEDDSSFIDDALTYADSHDVLVVVPSGNDGPANSVIDWPARNPLTVSVGAVGADGTVADFSSRGTNNTTKQGRQDAGDLEFVAPGVNIESTFLDNGYAVLSGTSMAAPHVAGLAAVVWQGQADHPAAATRALLHQLAQDGSSVKENNASGSGVPHVR